VTRSSWKPRRYAAASRWWLVTASSSWASRAIPYYLKHLPFDLVKIDGDFVRNLPRSTEDQLTVRAIAQICQGLGKETTAEWVQDAETLRLLTDVGIDFAQGNHIGPAVPVS
jgi:EAL domain-containing protein (putative c-di-GMP-specific phosphodiesterase class I)